MLWVYQEEWGIIRHIILAQGQSMYRQYYKKDIKYCVQRKERCFTGTVWEGFMGYGAWLSGGDRQGKVENSIHWAHIYLVLSVCFEQALFWVLGKQQLTKQTSSALMKFIFWWGVGELGRETWDKSRWSKIKYRSGKITGFGREYSSSFCLNEYFLFHINLHYSCHSWRGRERAGERARAWECKPFTE